MNMLEEQSSPSSSPEDADVRLGSRLASFRKNPLMSWCCKFGDAGDQGPLYFICTTVTVVGLIRRDRRMFGTGTSLLAAVVIAGGATKIIKSLVTRSRPRLLLDEGVYASEVGGSDDKAKQSFPSGHASRSVAAACVLAQTHPVAGAASLAAATVIGATRVAKGSHWPLDVAAGVLVGVVAEVATRPWVGRLSKSLFRHLVR